MYDNADRHIYLYAKGWYETTDPIDDLKTILAKRSNLKKEWVSLSDIQGKLIDIVFDVFEKEGLNRSWFRSFVVDCSKEDIVTACIAVIQNSRTRAFGVDLGDPDPNVLPIYISDVGIGGLK
jgi:hypothetical protein